MGQGFVKPVWDHDRADFDAVAASDTLVGVYIAWPVMEAHLEVPHLAFHIQDFRFRFINLFKKALLLVTGYSLLVTGLTGCGYTTRSMISNKYKTIYITPFVNKIDLTQETAVAEKYKVYRPMLELEITKAVINKFIFDGNLKPVKKETADLVLKGELTEFRRDPVRYTENNDVEEYRLNLVINLSLWDTRENKLVWQEPGFTGDTTYFTTFATGFQAVSEDTAVTAAITDLARRIVERAVEQW